MQMLRPLTLCMAFMGPNRMKPAPLGGIGNTEALNPKRSSRVGAVSTP